MVASRRAAWQPTLASDCRLTDPNGDGHAGYTIAISGAVQGDDCCRFKEASLFGAGRIARDTLEHSALCSKGQGFYPLGCNGGSCTRANATSCPGVDDTAVSVPLEPADAMRDGACDGIVRQHEAGRFFGSEPLVVTVACSN